MSKEIASRPVNEHEPQLAAQYIGMQARLLLKSDSLDPKTDFSLTAEEIRKKLGNSQTIEQSQITVSKLTSLVSLDERKAFWQERPAGFAEKMQQWKTHLVETVALAKDVHQNLFAKLGISTDSFGQQQAQDLYTHFFKNDKESPVEIFVKEIKSKYQNSDQQVDYASIQKDLASIKWFSHIFGFDSAQIITALFASEINAKTQVEQFSQSAESLAKTANLSSREVELLTKLAEKQKSLAPEPKPAEPADKPESQTHSEYSWNYERPDKGSFPLTLTYPVIAEKLREGIPAIFGKYSDEQLIAFVKEELGKLQNKLNDYGLTRDELEKLTLGVVDEDVIKNYRQFIKNEYQVELPEIDQIRVLPIDGKIAKAYNSNNRALAFVDSRYPVIFLNFNTIPRAAKQRAGTEWEVMSTQEKTEYIKRLLREIKPHEYSHLLSDLAYWKLKEKTKDNDLEIEYEAAVLPGKTGLKVDKPKNLHTNATGNAEFDFYERGRGLNEAVTVELTHQWAKSLKSKLDLPAYAGERTVLYYLMNVLAEQDHISTSEVFKKFVKGYFTPEGFAELVKFVSGREKDQDGRVSYRRPHFLSIIYALMEYEAHKNRAANSTVIYPLTTSDIWGNLSPMQKEELKSNLDHLALPKSIKEKLGTQIQ